MVIRSLLLALVVCLGTVSPALASPGQTLDAAMRVARAQKKDVMGVTYWVKDGRVTREYWSSEMAGWNDKAADRLRTLVAGKRKLKHKLSKGREVVKYTYTDGTVVQYNKRRGLILTMDVTSPAFVPAEMDTGKLKKIDDWKERPWRNKRW